MTEAELVREINRNLQCSIEEYHLFLEKNKNDIWFLETMARMLNH